MPHAILTYNPNETCDLSEITADLESIGHQVSKQFVPKLFTEWFECPMLRILDCDDGDCVYFGIDGINFYIEKYHGSQSEAR